MCRMGFVTGGPNEAIVVSGCFHSQPLIVVGGWAFVIPCIQKVQRLPLNIMTLKVASPTVYTMQGVPLSVTGIAQVFVYIFHLLTLPINEKRFLGGEGRIKTFFSYSSISAMRGSPTCIYLLATLLPGSVGLSLHLPGSPEPNSGFRSYIHKTRDLCFILSVENRHLE